MKVILLCAGYGTRLTKSIENDKSGVYTHIKGIPKPLLPINGIPLIGHWLNTFSKCKYIAEIFIVTNDAHKRSYEEILIQENRIPVKILSDGSSCNENRSGAVNCMQLGVGDGKDDCLFIAGDTLFDRDFNLTDVIEKFQKLKVQRNLSCLLLSAPVKEENVSKHGIIEVTEHGKVTSFLEKPEISETSSRLQNPCFYIIASESLHYIKDFLKEKKCAPLIQKDATGKFLCYLVGKSTIFAHHISRRFDIGDINSYAECCRNFKGFNEFN